MSSQRKRVDASGPSSTGVSAVDVDAEVDPEETQLHIQHVNYHTEGGPAWELELMLSAGLAQFNCSIDRDVTRALESALEERTDRAQLPGEARLYNHSFSKHAPAAVGVENDRLSIVSGDVSVEFHLDDDRRDELLEAVRRALRNPSTTPE